MKIKLIIPGELVDLNTYISAERRNRYAGAKIKQEMTDYITLLAKRLKTLSIHVLREENDFVTFPSASMV